MNRVDFWVFEGCFNKYDYNFDDVSKFGNFDIFLKKTFWNKGYDELTHIYDVTNTVSSCHSNYIVDIVMWPKFVNSSVSVREAIIPSILQGFG